MKRFARFALVCLAALVIVGIALLAFAPAVQAATMGSESRIVARLELAAPDHSPFLLRATLPIPKGIYPRDDGRSPFGVRFPGPEGRIVPAQVEIVSRYPTGEADVIEILARGELAPEVRAGARITCGVVFDPELETPEKQPKTPDSVRALLDPTKQGALYLRTRDVYGNLYVAELTTNPNGRGFGSANELKCGPWLRETREYATLVPVPGPNGAPGTSTEGPPLAHLMGVHAYVREIAGSEAVTIDVRVNNGAIAGSRAAGPLERVLGIVYWRSLELVAPKDWIAVAEVDDPFLGAAYDEGHTRVLPLVKRYDDGKLHMMGPQMQFERRVVLVTRGHEKLARALLDNQGLAFPLRGEGLWSWSNPATARYFPQRDVLGSVDFVSRDGKSGKGAVRAFLAADLASLRASLASGKPGAYYVEASVMGWAHPWFIKEQGGVGGEGIATFEGYYAAQSASREGYTQLQLLHRMNVSRQPEATYDARGDIVGYRAWLDSDGRIPFDYRTHGRVVIPDFRLPMNAGPAASPQVREVVKRGLRPAYDQGTPFEPGGDHPNANEVLLSWWPHDDQHLVRYTKNTKALVWLGNDSMAKDDLRLSAELFRLMFHESPHIPAEWSPGLTLRLWEGVVKEHPHDGLPIGREHAWGLDAMCAAYSTASPTWRERERPWFARVADLLLAGRQPSGLIQRSLNERFFDTTEYLGAQTFECLFLIHALRCVDESVLRGVDDPRRLALEALARTAVDYLFFGPPWQRITADWQPDPEHPTLFFQGPRQTIAVSMNDERATPPFSDSARWGPNYLPKGGLGGGVEFFHVWAALSFAHDITEGQQGTGLENRYLKRALDCWTPHAAFADLLHDLYAQAGDSSSDNSANWIGFAGKLQNLGVR